MANASMRTVLFAFIAGAVGFLVFHQGGFWALTQAGVLKANTWSMATTRPLGVPAVISYVFWTGLWGVVAALVVPRLPGALRGPWGWILFAAIVPTLVNWFIVLPLKGAPMGGGFNMPGVALAPLVYGFWGLGMWLVMQLLQQTTSSGARA
ncbi:hypothetical protein [Vineibacter terrae]|uniref:hypothetical protein n=1 Tax=Vineibacter terrae TaxID=2586908 RepID=UPI001C49A5C7|nr:hypothetical protein [Vineibacter terrae]